MSKLSALFSNCLVWLFLTTLAGKLFVPFCAQIDYLTFKFWFIFSIVLESRLSFWATAFIFQDNLLDKLDEVETEKAGSSDEEVSTKHIINSGTLEQGTPGSPRALLDFQIRKIKSGDPLPKICFGVPAYHTKIRLS